MAELKPCPFCGNADIVVFGGDGILPDGGDYWYVTCFVCGCSLYGSDSRTEVVNSWNRRAEVALGGNK